MRDAHPAADLFPLLEGEEYDALRDDIARNGLHEAIWIDKSGKVLDGRNRQRACKETGVIAHFRAYEGNDPIGFVLSLNLKRRHLNASQRAVLALSVESMLAEEGRKRMAKAGASAAPGRSAEKGPEILPEVSGESREQAGAQVGVSGRYVSDAKKIQEEAPELLADIRDGNLTLPEAKKMIRDRAKAAATPVTDAEAEHIEAVLAADPAVAAARLRVDLSGLFKASSFALTADPVAAANATEDRDREWNADKADALARWLTGYRKALGLGLSLVHGGKA